MARTAPDQSTTPVFRVIPDWEQLPPDFRHGDVAGVAVDSQDRVFILTRRDARCLIYEPDGTFLRSFGEDVFTERAHGLTIDAQDFIYTVDDGDHTVRKFAPDGTLLMTLGTPGVPSDTGYDGTSTTSITHVGPPFNRPTNAAIAPNGDIYIADGYGNARIHRFSADGELIASWGEPGRGPGQFVVPHGIWIADDRVFVADRENDRVQIFTLGGELLETWDHVQRPTDIFVDRRGLVYVSSLWWRGGEADMWGKPRPYDLPGGVYVLDLNGNVLTHWTSADRCAPGSFVAPHCITADSRGDIYVGEVTWTFGVQRGDIPADCHTFQKLERRKTRERKTMGSQKSYRSCACGCGEMTRGGTFRPGHDAKLRSKYLARIDDGDEMAIDEFLEKWPNLAYPYGYDRPKLLARLGQGKK